MNYHSRKLLKLNLAPWRMATVGGLLLGWFVLQAFVFPGLGVST